MKKSQQKMSDAPEHAGLNKRTNSSNNSSPASGVIIIFWGVSYRQRHKSRSARGTAYYCAIGPVAWKDWRNKFQWHEERTILTRFCKKVSCPPLWRPIHPHMMNYHKVYREAVDSQPHYKTIMQGQGNQNQATRKFVVDEFDQKVIFLCQFCGGQSCKHQDYRSNSKLPNAIEGLNSNWITENILAMQRPSERLIKEYNLYKNFKDKNIKAVLNLQQPGEHPYCGDGIIPTVGFSYIPQHFYQHGIQCFNQSWEDMTSTTFQHMMRIMNIFELSLRDQGKISVHCHAGRGRTLLVICSWLIYNDRIQVQEVIKLAVQKRQGVLASNNQRQFLRFFEKQLQIRWNSFSVDPVHRSLTQFVEWQTLALLNKQKKKLYSTPVAHFRIIRQLKRRAQKDPSGVLHAFLSPHSIYFKSKWDQKCQVEVERYKRQINALKFQSLKVQQDQRIIFQLLFDFYENLPFTLLTSVSLDCLKDELAKNVAQKSRLKFLLSPSIVHCLGVSTVAVLLDLVSFAKSLLTSVQTKSEKGKLQRQQAQESKEQNKKIENNIQQTLFMSLALLMCSKRKYFTQIFGGQKLRDSKIYKLVTKVRKAVGQQIAFFADFLKDLSKEIPSEWQQIEGIIFKVRKVESNLFYLLREGDNRSLSAEQKFKVYESARLGKLNKW